MALFDSYIAVDWSAANSPKRGRDSIWIAVDDAAPENISTRAEVMFILKTLMVDAVAHKKRILIGFDFAFGYPAGIAKTLTDEAQWEALWAHIAGLIEDRDDNTSNRYDVAANLNRRLGFETGPFWGHPWQHRYDGLQPRKDKSVFETLPEFRQVEAHAKGAKSVWQLAYNGAVGSQTLLGIARLEQLRGDPDIGQHISIWPFETQFAGDLSKPITIAEIYPSSHIYDASKYDTLDAAQVAAVARDFAAWDEQNLLEDKLSGPQLTDKLRERIMREEGWIVGR